MPTPRNLQMSTLIRLGIFVTGLYIGKYYPQYIPLPQLNQETLNRVLTYLRELERNNRPPPPQ